MMWPYPHQVSPENYLPLIGGPLVWFLLLPLVSAAHWRVEVLRVQMLYGFAHFKALLDTVRNRTAGWVPTGALKAPNPVATVVLRTIHVVVPFNLIALVTGVIHVTLAFGIEHVWPAVLYGLIYTYITIPLLFAPRVLLWRDILALQRSKVGALAALVAALVARTRRMTIGTERLATRGTPTKAVIIAVALCIATLLASPTTSSTSAGTSGRDDAVPRSAANLASGQAAHTPTSPSPTRSSPNASIPSMLHPVSTRNQTQP
jgi:hypothetical protein